MPTSMRFNWVRVIQIGLIGGVLALLVSLVGMVQEFSERDIIAGVITMGLTVLFLIFMLTGYIAAARLLEKPGVLAVIGSALAGLISAGLLALLVLAMQEFNLRPVLVYSSPQLIKILTFDKGLNPGLFYLLGVGMAVGVLGGIIYILPNQIRRAVTSGLTWVALLGLLQQLIQVSLGRSPAVDDALAWMFGKGTEKGLSTFGAIFVFFVVALGSFLWANQGPRVRGRIQALPPSGQRSLRWGGIALLVFILFYLPILLGLYLSEVVNQVGLFILLGLGLNIVVGFAGLLDLGYVAFYAIGAYTMGVFTTASGELVWAAGWNFWQALPVAIGMATLAGIILGIPVLGMRGDYLAIVTLGFGEIIRILALSDFLKPFIGGSQGIVSIPPAQISSFAANNSQRLYYLIVVGILIALFIANRLRDSRIGRSWKALREDEDVAQAMGINLVLTKLLAFATGAAFSGLSGAILASKLGTIYPHSFALLISINVLSVVIVGGLGSIPGVFVGSLILVGLPELLREFAEYRLWIYGALLVVMMLTRPEGFWPEATHKREFHEEHNTVLEMNP